MSSEQFSINFMSLDIEKPYRSSQIGVGVDISARNVVLLSKAFDLMNESNDSLELLVGLSKGSLELGMSINQALDLVQCVHDEHVHQVLAGAV